MYMHTFIACQTSILGTALHNMGREGFHYCSHWYSQFQGMCMLMFSIQFYGSTIVSKPSLHSIHGRSIWMLCL